MSIQHAPQDLAIIPPEGAAVPLEGAAIPQEGAAIPLEGAAVPLEGAAVPLEGAAVCARSDLVSEPIGEASATGLAQVFKALGDPVRLRLVSLIGARRGGEVCVCDLTSAFDLSQPTISHHLKVLREAGLIESERRGTWVYYRLVTAALQRMARLLSVPADAP